MKIWIPNPLYQAFPLLAVLAGFFMVALVPNPLGVMTAACMYIYAFKMLWLRTQNNISCDE